MNQRFAVLGNCLLVVTISSTAIADQLASGPADEYPAYPAPPGYYGQEKILKNAQLNTGTGVPYLNIITPEDPALTGNDKKQANQDQAAANSVISKSKIPAAPVNQPTVNRPTVNQPALIRPDTFKAEPVHKPESSAQPQAKQHYPNAQVLNQYYQQAKQLPFEQWGSEQNDLHGQTPSSYPTLDYPQRQDYPRTGNTSQPIAATQKNYHGSADLARMFNAPQGYRSQPVMPTMPFQAPTSLTHPMPSSLTGQTQPRPGSRFNPNLNPNLKPGLNQAMRFSPPSVGYLESFEGFPVPQNLYSMPPQAIPNALPFQNSRQYRPVPREEIIYPPSYPGIRR